MSVKTIKIQDTGKGKKSVADDLKAVLRKIEGWHQGSVTGFLISHRDTHGAWHQVIWDGEKATVKSSFVRILKTKICAYCHKRKPLTEYHRVAIYTSGRFLLPGCAKC
jgi:hypothetical protein